MFFQTGQLEWKVLGMISHIIFNSNQRKMEALKEMNLLDR